jgi:hypothetical protein
MNLLSSAAGVVPSRSADPTTKAFLSPSGLSQILYRRSTPLKGKGVIHGVRKQLWRELGNLTLFFLPHTPVFRHLTVSKNFSGYPRPM